MSAPAASPIHPVFANRRFANPAALATLLVASATLLAGCGGDAVDAPPASTGDPDVAAIEIPAETDLADSLVEGKATCFVFVLPEQKVTQAIPTSTGVDIERIAATGRVAVRTIEIDLEGGDALARRLDIRSTPWIVLFDEKGERIAEGFDGAVFARLEGL